MVNDGSTDETASVIRSVNDERIQVIETNNGGAAKARNLAFTSATGDYIIFFDADDYVGANFISSQVEKTNGQKDIVVMSAWGRFYHNDLTTLQIAELPQGELSFKEWINKYWYNCNPMTNPGRALIPVDLIKKAGLWNENLTLNDDLEFFTRIFLTACKIVFNADAVFYYRSGINGLSASTGDKACKSLFESIKLSVHKVLREYEHNSSLLISCANMWRSFIYITYPYQKKHLQLAQAEIAKLGKPDFKFQAGGVTALLTSLLGWKMTKRIKLLTGGSR